MENGSRHPHIAIPPSPGMGHLIPLAELAKGLILGHGFAATFIIFSNFSSPAQDAYINSLRQHGISSLSLPPAPLHDLPAGTRVETIIAAMVTRSVPAITAILRSLKQTTRLAAYVVDLFGGDTLPPAKELNIPSYYFFTCNFMSLSLFFHLPSLHNTTSGEYRDLPVPVRLPGCVPLHGVDLFDAIQDRSNEAYGVFLNIANRLKQAEGIMVNSFEEMESAAAKILMAAKPGFPAVYSVGPLINSCEGDSAECLTWLDRQPYGSVLYVSFGSGGTLSTEQMREVALGLERSGQRFLWVLRCPFDKHKSGVYFSQESIDDPLSYLPEGFLERTKDSGFLVKDWAPQIQILSHKATGGFLTHCGWNSTLESVVRGVPMIAWPLYAEQRMNAVMLVEDVKIALRPKEGKDGVIRAAEMASVVKELIEGDGGKAARNKVKELQAAAARALAKEGSCYKALGKVAGKWKDALAV